MDHHDLEVCIDKYPPGESYDPTDLVDPMLGATVPEELAFASRKAWQPGQELQIRFMDGDSRIRRQVELHASQWLEYANLMFRFGDFAGADIRVTFHGHGYWSYVGQDAIQLGPDQPTMTLSSLDMRSEEVVRSVVLHEFGHAIGCVHEQSSPAVDIPWDEEKVYQYYRATERWDDETIWSNVLYRYGPGAVRFSDFDPQSIMQYPVDKSLTRGGFEIGWNTVLSAGDKAFIAKMYPYA